MLYMRRSGRSRFWEYKRGAVVYVVLAIGMVRTCGIDAVHFRVPKRIKDICSKGDPVSLNWSLSCGDVHLHGVEGQTCRVSLVAGLPSSALHRLDMSKFPSHVTLHLQFRAGF